MLAVPDGSIYFWMFTQGLKQVDLDSILAACSLAGKDVRSKDIENYWNGWYRSSLHGTRDILKFPRQASSPTKDFYTKSYDDYPIHPFLGKPEIQKRYVPCSNKCRPLIKWSDGCLTFDEAKDFAGSQYVAENLYGTKFIVIDIDGDHDKQLDLETIDFGWQFFHLTESYFKIKLVQQYDGYEDTGIGKPASFHLTFKVDRLIPTMHFHKAHIDILGNEKNTLRNFKTKYWNRHEPMDMTSDTWEVIKSYIRRREEV